MSLCVCVWAMLPDSNKMMMIIFFLFMLPCALLNGLKLVFFVHSLNILYRSIALFTHSCSSRSAVCVFLRLCPDDNNSFKKLPLNYTVQHAGSSNPSLAYLRGSRS